MFKHNAFFILVFFTGLFFSGHTYAQQGFGTSQPSSNAVVDMVCGNKGLLLPRIALTAANVSTPISAHVEGMVVYNTVTNGAAPNGVVPGYYFNNGQRWVKILMNEEKAWYNTATALPADANTQNIYQSGKVGVGTTTPVNQLHVVGDGTIDPLVVQGLNEQVDKKDYKLLVVNPTDGLIRWSDIPTPESFILQSTSGTQVFPLTAFGSTSVATPAVIQYAATDILLASASGFATLDPASGIITINTDGSYDMTTSCNLFLSTGTYRRPGNTAAVDNDFMNITVAIEKRINSSGAWTKIAGISNTINFGAKDLIVTLKPATTLQPLVKDNQLRVVIYRGGGIYMTAGTPSTGGVGGTTGVYQHKSFKMTKYN